MVEMQQQLRQAELAFVRKLGQLKYLTHLKKNNVIENCPICQTQPTEKVRTSRSFAPFYTHTSLKYFVTSLSNSINCEWPKSQIVYVTINWIKPYIPFSIHTSIRLYSMQCSSADTMYALNASKAGWELLQANLIAPFVVTSSTDQSM